MFWLHPPTGTVVLALVEQLMLEALEVGQHLSIADLVTRTVAVLLLLASDQSIELHVMQVIELGRIDELDVFEG